MVVSPLSVLIVLVGLSLLAGCVAAATVQMKALARLATFLALGGVIGGVGAYLASGGAIVADQMLPLTIFMVLVPMALTSVSMTVRRVTAGTLHFTDSAFANVLLGSVSFLVWSVASVGVAVHFGVLTV